MTVADDIRSDYQHVDGIETVTHAGTATAQGLRRRMNYREVAFSGPAGLQPTDVVWELWDATLGRDPVQGDTVTDSAGDVWTILSCEADGIGATVIKWICPSRKQAA